MRKNVNNRINTEIPHITWNLFRGAIESFERELERIKYTSAFEPHDLSVLFEWNPLWNRPPAGSITLEQAAFILSAESVAFPHGFDVLCPPSLPKLPLPSFPARPSQPPGQYDGRIVEKAQKLESRLADLQLRLDCFREAAYAL